MFDDYKLFYSQNEDFFNHLLNHKSIVFDRLNDVIVVMNYISNLEKKDITEDIELIFDVGFAYLFNKVTELNAYLLKNFNNNIHEFLKFEELINYGIYLDDLKDTLIEKESYSEFIKEGFEEIQSKIEQIVESKSQYSLDIIDEFNAILLSIIPSNKEFLTVPEIFMRVAEELQI